MTTAEKKLVKHRLSVLELAQALGNLGISPLSDEGGVH